tara:strand:+ start:3067 stop:4416 length:1350 start_codon:yes stop_codon:yes gene_type:complete
MIGEWCKVAGWGKVPVAESFVVPINDANSVTEAIAHAGQRGSIPRGLGRSYGDAAQRSGGVLLDTQGLKNIQWVNKEEGILEAAGGVSIGELIEYGEAEGWFPPVTPGTRHVTVGGAIAADIHGKNHHVAGSFGEHVLLLDLVIPNGETLRISPRQNTQLFWATVGGLGLTGLILKAQIRMLRVPGTQMMVTTSQTKNLDETMQAMKEADSQYTYTVSWLDLMATGSQLGRGVITKGEHTGGSQKALSKPLVSVPNWWNINIVKPSTIRVFNEAWYRKAPAKPKTSQESFGSYFYPLDGIRQWNLLYGHRGFLQYQFVVPFEAEELLYSIIHRFSKARLPIFLAVLKRFGQGSKGLISFPKPGWTLTLDLPIPSNNSSIGKLLEKVDFEIAESEGRIYLAKDSRMRHQHITRMYPKISEFNEIRKSVDPSNVLISDLSERLRLSFKHAP